MKSLVKKLLALLLIVVATAPVLTSIGCSGGGDSTPEMEKNLSDEELEEEERR